MACSTIATGTQSSRAFDCFRFWDDEERVLEHVGLPADQLAFAAFFASCAFCRSRTSSAFFTPLLGFRVVLLRP